ncbi:hypothetical protein [Paenibacillus fonticola]|uniref:hypothetical protein n=1 Tax=Paenibacillus fonticola TaxID=379896 RepID=UPI00039DC8B2|nr:hypothetical protein [Paenibacillus fonticola]
MLAKIPKPVSKSSITRGYSIGIPGREQANCSNASGELTRAEAVYRGLTVLFGTHGGSAAQEQVIFKVLGS